jgi:hypothetical protein
LVIENINLPTVLLPRDYDKDSAIKRAFGKVIYSEFRGVISRNKTKASHVKITEGESGCILNIENINLPTVLLPLSFSPAITVRPDNSISASLITPMFFIVSLFAMLSLFLKPKPQLVY